MDKGAGEHSRAVSRSKHEPCPCKLLTSRMSPKLNRLITATHPQAIRTCTHESAIAPLPVAMTVRKRGEKGLSCSRGAKAALPALEFLQLRLAHRRRFLLLPELVHRLFQL